MEDKKGVGRKYQDQRSFNLPRANRFLSSLGVLGLFLLGPLGFFTAVTHGSQSALSFKEEVNLAINKWSVPLMEAVSKNDIHAIQGVLHQIISDAEKEGKPIRFGIGILGRNGTAVTGRNILGIFRKEDFLKYEFVRKAFKKRKIIQERLYLQDRSELLIICAPLVQQKKVVGALVLGFNPTEVKKDYGLDTEQFLVIDFNQ